MDDKHRLELGNNHQLVIDDEIWREAQRNSGLNDPTTYILYVLTKMMEDEARQSKTGTE